MRTASPLVRGVPAVEPNAPPRPARHTPAELATLLGLLHAQRPRVGAVTIGHGRDAVSVAAAEAFADAWEGAGGHVLAVVDWPEEAASWLRPARRLVAGAPDAWVVAGTALGWAQMSRRLRHSTDWDARRTFGFASVLQSLSPAGSGTLRGLRGASAGGGTWEIGHDLVVRHREPSP
jgi:hypothetical protein